MLSTPGTHTRLPKTPKPPIKLEVRLTVELAAAPDEWWRFGATDLPGRPEAARRLLELALGAEAGRGAVPQRRLPHAKTEDEP